MPTSELKLSASGLPDKDLIGRTDAYYELYFKDTLLYKSEVQKGSNVTWDTATIDMPKRAYMRELVLKCFDKDRFSKDDLIFSVEIRYPFRMKTYTLGETGATLSVLNDNGESADSLSDGSMVDGDDGKKRKRKKKQSGHFKMLKLGKALLDMKK